MHLEAPMKAGVLLLFGLFSSSVQTSSAQDEKAMTTQPARSYLTLLEDCGRTDSSGVHFFSAFEGLWPIPGNFVLLDASRGYLEYDDRAFPWTDVHSASTIFFGRREVIEQHWGSIFSQRGQEQPGICSLKVKRYRSVELGKTVVVVSGRYDHLLLVGPIADTVSSAMECHASTRRQTGSC